MGGPEINVNEAAPHRGAFPTTRWTLIRAAKTSPEARREALTQLMTVYWRPLYVFFRTKGLDATAAQDAVQDLLVQVLERGALDRVDPEKGRLRAYLRTMAGNYLINQHDKAVAAKRGAGAVAISLDDAGVAERLVPGDAVPPDVAFERAWAQTVMNRALEQLKNEFESGERSGPFEVVALFFGGASGPTPSYREVAARHGMSLPQLKAFLHRARTRYRELVRAAVVDTVDDQAEADAEWAGLAKVLTT